MRNNLPVNMPHSEKLAIQAIKFDKILNFLGNDCEVFSTIAIIAMLLNVSQSNARRALLQLCKENQNLLVHQKHFICGKQCSIFAITELGLLAIEAPSEAVAYDSRISSNYINHKVQNQRISIISQQQLKATYTNERQLRNKFKNIKKIPDGLVEAHWLDPHMVGNRVFTEIELSPKQLSK